MAATLTWNDLDLQERVGAGQAGEVWKAKLRRPFRDLAAGDVVAVKRYNSWVMHKLEQQGWIRGEWRASENNRRAKFYSLTRAGEKHLARETANWERVAGAITRVLTLGDPGSTAA